jgi:hypothetical protein
VSTYQIVLYIHLLALLLATGTATIVHLGDLSMRRAQTLSEAGRWGLLIKRSVIAFPIAAVVLFGSGAYMVSDVWSWSTPWVLAAICGLAAIMLMGDLVNGRNARKVGEAIGGTLARQGDGPLTDEIVALLENPVSIAASFAPTVLMLGVVYVMTAKPGAGGSAATLLVCVAVAAAMGPLLARRGAKAPAAAAAAAEPQA